MYVLGLATALPTSSAGTFMDLRGTHRSTRVIITEYWLRVGLSVISDAAINSLLGDVSVSRITQLETHSRGIR